MAVMALGLTQCQASADQIAVATAAREDHPNLSGEVVGVNAAIATQSGGFEGIGFAIPSNIAVHVAKALIDHGKIVRGWLGVSVRDLTPEQIKSMKRKASKGSLIAEVVPNSPVETAGLK